MKIAVITGGNRGVGKSTAINVAKRGVGVILTYNSHPEEAERVVSEIDKNGGKAIALKLDVSKTSSLGDFAALAEQVLENEWKQKTFDYLVNNQDCAAHLDHGPLRRSVRSTGECSLQRRGFSHAKVTPAHVRRVNVVNISTAMTWVASPAGTSIYSSAKGAMEVFNTACRSGVLREQDSLQHCRSGRTRH